MDHDVGGLIFVGGLLWFFVLLFWGPSYDSKKTPKALPELPEMPEPPPELESKNAEQSVYRQKPEVDPYLSTPQTNDCPRPDHADCIASSTKTSSGTVHRYKSESGASGEVEIGYKKGKPIITIKAIQGVDVSIDGDKVTWKDLT